MIEWARSKPQIQGMYVTPEDFLNRHVFRTDCGRVGRDGPDIMQGGKSQRDLDKLHRLQSAMLTDKWVMVPEKRSSDYWQIPIVVDCDGLIIDGFHRPFALSMLWIQVDRIPLVFLFGWPKKLIPWKRDAKRFANAGVTKWLEQEDLTQPCIL